MQKEKISKMNRVIITSVASLKSLSSTIENPSLTLSALRIAGKMHRTELGKVKSEIIIPSSLLLELNDTSTIVVLAGPEFVS